MKKTFSLIACCCSIFLLISVFLLSCKKDSGPGSLHGANSRVRINLSYRPNNTDVKNFELIISCKNGTILSDTIKLVDTKISASLKTIAESNLKFIYNELLGKG